MNGKCLPSFLPSKNFFENISWYNFQSYCSLTHTNIHTYVHIYKYTYKTQAFTSVSKTTFPRCKFYYNRTQEQKPHIKMTVEICIDLSAHIYSQDKYYKVSPKIWNDQSKNMDCLPLGCGYLLCNLQSSPVLYLQ